MNYKHTQISYMMIIITLAIIAFFTRAYITSSAEPQSVNSGTNFAITLTMVLIIITLSSFVSLKVTVDKKYLGIKFGYGFFHKKFSLEDIASAKATKNHRYYGRGIRVWFWPKMWIFNVSGFDAVEIKLKNGKIYRIGTNEPQKLEKAIISSIK